MAGFRIETERLVIREWEASDLPAFRALATDPRVMRYIAAGTPWSDAEIESFLARQAAHAARLGYCLGALVEKGDEAPIGLAGLQPLGTTGEVETGWWLAPERWGRGLAREAGRGSLDFAFGRARLERVAAIAHPENRASLRVMERFGMQSRGRRCGHQLGLRQPEVEVVLYVAERPEPGAGP